VESVVATAVANDAYRFYVDYGKGCRIVKYPNDEAMLIVTKHK